MNIFIDLWKKTKIQYKYTLISTVIFGIISQGMGLFNTFVVSDNLLDLLSGGFEFFSGRWMLYYFRKSEKLFYGDGFFSLPIINGGIAIILIAVTLCLLIDLLDIRSRTACILLGGIAVSIPGITCLFGHMHVAHYYSFALLFSVLGPCLIIKKDRWFFILIGIGLMICSTAVYQAYIPVMLSVFLFGLIKLFAESSGREQRITLYKKTGIVVFSCIAFISIYFLLTFAINKYYGIALSDYKNLSAMGKMPLTVYAHRAIAAYKDFLLPVQNTYYNVFPGNTRILYMGILLISFLLFGKMLYSKRKDAAAFSILFFLIFLIPLAVNFIFVMVDPSDCSALMVYGKTMFFVVVLWVFEKETKKNHSMMNRIGKVICVGSLCILIIMFCRFDNTCYLRMALVQTEATRYYSTLVTRIQSVEGYDSWKYVSYIGLPQPGNDNSIETIPELEHIVMHPYYNLKNTVKGNWREYMRIWCGFTAHEVDQSYFIDNPEVQLMPHYPAEGSIQVINDTVVIKF